MKLLVSLTSLVVVLACLQSASAINLPNFGGLGDIIGGLCLTCCGPKPCCNCCGMPNCEGQLQVVALPEKPVEKINTIPTVCLMCCGPSPCCNTCGLTPIQIDFLQLITDNMYKKH